MEITLSGFTLVMFMYIRIAMFVAYMLMRNLPLVTTSAWINSERHDGHRACVRWTEDVSCTLFCLLSFIDCGLRLKLSFRLYTRSANTQEDQMYERRRGSPQPTNDLWPPFGQVLIVNVTWCMPDEVRRWQTKRRNIGTDMFTSGCVIY